MNRAMVVFTVGFLMTFGGVGTLEQDPSTAGLVAGIVVSGLGLLVMYVGTLGLKEQV